MTLKIPSKSIRTLVPDIYKLLETGTNIKKENLDYFMDDLRKVIEDGLSPEKSKTNILRMSNFGTKCERELWYKLNKPELAEALPPWAIYKFLYGHILEHLTLFLAKESGHNVEGQQDELEIEGIVGHRDAVIDGVLVDAKSANSRGMAKFREHALESDDPFGYLDQLSLYLAACANDERVAVKGEAAFLAIDKELGYLVLDTYKLASRDWAKEVSRKRAMLAEPNPPDRPYQPVPEGSSGNMRLDTKCSYCPFKQECWKDANQGEGLIKYTYSTGPKFFTKITKEPRVPKEF